jgi:hypothetical protein
MPICRFSSSTKNHTHNQQQGRLSILTPLAVRQCFVERDKAHVPHVESRAGICSLASDRCPACVSRCRWPPRNMLTTSNRRFSPVSNRAGESNSICFKQPPRLCLLLVRTQVLVRAKGQHTADEDQGVQSHAEAGRRVGMRAAGSWRWGGAGLGVAGLYRVTQVSAGARCRSPSRQPPSRGTATVLAESQSSRARS